MYLNVELTFPDTTEDEFDQVFWATVDWALERGVQIDGGATTSRREATFTFYVEETDRTDPLDELNDRLHLLADALEAVYGSRPESFSVELEPDKVHEDAHILVGA